MSRLVIGDLAEKTKRTLYIPAAPPPSGGGGPPVWEGVATTFGTLTGAGTTPTQPSGVVSTDLLVMYLSNITTGMRTGMSVPSGWTLRGEVYSEFAGLGHAVYTASGSVGSAAWTSSGGSDAAFDMHRISGADLATPVRDFDSRTSVDWPNFEDNDMPSPAGTASAGDLVFSHYHQPQSTTAVSTPTSGYTRRVDSATPNRRSTLTRENVSAGSTGEISHNTASPYEGRTSSTLVIATA